MSPPPVVVRRLLTRPIAFVVGLLLALVLLPCWLLSTVLVSLNIAAVARPLRLFCFAYVYLVVEVVGLIAALGHWVRAGGATATDTAQARNHALLGDCLTVLLTAAEYFFSLDIESHPSESAEPEAPMIVVSRHAGPGDSFLLVHRLIVGLNRRPHVVLKSTLQWDPLLDVLLTRSANVFVTAGEPTDAVVRRITDLARGLGVDDALLIFPEGGNFTENRRTQVIERLRANGHHAAAQRAEDLERLLAPRITGLQSALVARPDAAVCVVAHTGLDEIDTLAEVWDAVPVRNTLLVSWEYFAADDVPRDPTGLHDWLGYHWQLMDTWVAVESARLAAAAESSDNA
ncbi:MAG: 1-acyl-sn-glycerol-3-phosphate acyltransferase [Actinobacteria bacterium]|nr:1-acyl-sn-glycerol-3-phosphate acyltransferase [Actinomycetota bacterium]MCB9412756.1 1-acyl-sn-glycerol-3-phosphate acyltransferase [Actinomycetota bacterium]